MCFSGKKRERNKYNYSCLKHYRARNGCGSPPHLAPLMHRSPPPLSFSFLALPQLQPACWQQPGSDASDIVLNDTMAAYQSAAALSHLCQAPSRIRNFCVVAHVDHGKTTLSDYLIASNGILSQQLAGDVRLMDSRPDEQERCITMKASSIALEHTYQGQQHLLNLVDSPGHIDFSCEVSTAMRLCDGAVILVDVVDGVRQQTHNMLRHAFKEGLSMCLVLNKIDRFIVAQQCTAEEAYDRMRSIIETCNATLAAYKNQQRIQEGVEVEEDDEDDETWFDPTHQNVVFCSCRDGWAFQLKDFAKLYTKLLPDVTDLETKLWGEYYLDSKTKSVTQVRKKTTQQPLAVQLVLEPLWAMYATFSEDGEDEARGRMAAKVGVPERVWNHPRRDLAAKLKAVLSAWLPLAPCVLRTICEVLDNPITAMRRRIDRLIPGHEGLPQNIKTALLNCDTSSEAPCVVYVCKLIDTQYLVGKMIGAEECQDDAFIGFARVYSGRLHSQQKVFIHSDGRIEEGVVSKVFMFRGAGLEEIDTVYAGSLCGVGGLTGSIIKYATVSSEAAMIPFQPLALPSTSIVQFSVYPKDPKELHRLEKGLRMLYKVDPQVELSLLPTGEQVIGTAGEVHAERCLKDLVDTFAQVEVVASEPIVRFRETIIGSGNAKAKPYTASVGDGAFKITLSARPLPAESIDVLKDDAENLADNPRVRQQLEASLLTHRRFARLLRRTEGAVGGGLYAYGPTKLGFIGCVLLVELDVDEVGEDGAATPCASEDSQHQMRLLREWWEWIVAGFQAAAESGPMAQEPMFGIAFIISHIEVQQPPEGAPALVGGLVLPCVRDACRAAMEFHPRRLVEPMLDCTVYSSGTTQGKIYGALSRRRSEIIEEVPNEGSDLFYIKCLLPAVEAFGLQDELRVQTQGASNAQLQMSHWALIEADPFFVPTTREEIEEHGSEVGTKNIAEQLLEKIRRRKGLYRERVVQSAEKQKFSLKGA
eukprot:gene9261-6512_t